MSEDLEGEEIRRGMLGLSARAIALRVTALAVAAFSTVAFMTGSFGWPTVAAAVLAFLLVLVFIRDRRPLKERIAVRRERGESAPSPALVLAALPDPVVIVDRRGLVTLANRAAHEVLPALKEAAPLAFALRAPDVLAGLDAVLHGGGAREVQFVERVPVERTFQVHIAPLEADTAAKPRSAAAVLVFHDLTAARRLEHMRVDFVANASHELRTPLATLLGFIETLQGPARNDAEARERFLAIMREQARRMARLIDDLLSLSRIELSAHVQPETTVDLLSLVRHMIEALTPLASERGVEIALKADADALLVRGERDELLRVLENLIENAVKYGQSGGRVEVGARAVAETGRGEEAEVAVRDFGPGIAPEHLPRLTERFYRVDVAASREKGGTGLGLAIVKHILARHRGSLTIDSKPGEGAVFTVRLPLASLPATRRTIAVNEG